MNGYEHVPVLCFGETDYDKKMHAMGSFWSICAYFGLNKVSVSKLFVLYAQVKF